MKTFMTCSALALAVTAMPLQAQSPEPGAFELRMLQMGGRGNDFDQLEERLRQNFLRWEADGVAGYSEADGQLLEVIEKAAARAQMLRTYLNDDLNGDFEVTTEELRIQAIRRASAPLRASGAEVSPSEDQIKQLAARFLNKSLAADTDGDGKISRTEMVAAADAQIERRGSRSRTGMRPDMRYDENGDGRLTEDEFISGMLKFATSLDTNGDRKLSREETQALATQIRNRQSANSQRKHIREFMDKAGLGTFSEARAACKMTKVADGTEVVVVGGYEGAALSNLWIGEKGTAEVVDITVPAEGAPIHLIAPFFRSTILRLNDPGQRVASVVSTKGQVGVMGGRENLTFERTDDACHLHLQNRVTNENPEPTFFYESLVGQPVKTVVRGYTLGTVDLGRTENKADALQAGALAPMEGQASAPWTQFMQFNPGGFVTLKAEDVQAPVTVGTHEVWPQYAGIAQLVADGALVPLPRVDTADTVLESDEGKIRLGGKTFVPGSGDDVIVMGGLYYIEERPKTWVGRKPQVYLMTRPVTLPAGLSGAHGLHLAVPDGMEKPKGAGRGVRILDLNSEAFTKLMKK